MATNKQIKFPIETLTDEKLYQIADSIARTCATLKPETVEKNSKFYFRELINSDIIIAGTRLPLNQAFVEDVAIHITNLVLQRLQAPALTKGVAQVEVA